MKWISLKKIETHEMTKQKMLAVKNDMRTHFINDPHPIGSTPAFKNQEAIAFECRMNECKNVMKDHQQVKGNHQLTIDQLCLMKSDLSDWMNFSTNFEIF